MTMTIKEIFRKILRREEVPDYPREYAIIDFPEQVKKEEIKDDQNKMIYLHYIDRLGFREIEKHKYSKAKVYSLLKNRKIPYVDLTRREETIPTISKIDLSKFKYSR